MSSYFSSRDMSDSDSSGNVEVEPDSVRTRIWKHMPNTSPYPTEHSQEWKPEPTQETTWKQERRSEGESTWKQEQNCESSHSTCYRKQSAGTFESEKEFGTEQSPMHHYMGKVSLNLQKKLRITEGSSVKELGPIETN